MRTVIYTRGSGKYDGFHNWVEQRWQSMRRDQAWWFPEIDYSVDGAIPRHPREQIEMVPDMVGNRIITMSEHIILAFQQMVRDRRLDPDMLYLYCGNTLVEVDEDGDLVNWRGPFFNERLALLR